MNFCAWLELMNMKIRRREGVIAFDTGCQLRLLLRCHHSEFVEAEVPCPRSGLLQLSCFSWVRLLLWPRGPPLSLPLRPRNLRQLRSKAERNKWDPRSRA